MPLVREVDWCFVVLDISAFSLGLFVNFSHGGRPFSPQWAKSVSSAAMSDASVQRLSLIHI